MITSLDTEKNPNILETKTLEPPLIVFILANSDVKKGVSVPSNISTIKAIVGVTEKTVSETEKFFNEDNNKYNQTKYYNWVLVAVVSGFKSWENGKGFFNICHQKKRGIPSRTVMLDVAFNNYKKKQEYKHLVIWGIKKDKLQKIKSFD